MRKAFLLFASCIYSSFSFAQYVGIGTTTPTAGLEMKGAGLGAQQRITDLSSGNSLVFQAGAAGNMKVTGYNYGNGTAQPLYLSVDGANTLINSNGGKVGIGTTNPATQLTVYTPFSPLGSYGIEHTDGTVRLNTFLNPSGGWIGTKSNHPLNFYTNDKGQQMTLTTAGQVGIGITSPTGGYLLDVAGPVKSVGNSAYFVAQTTGGTNSWARFYMRSGTSPNYVQSWFIGTSRDYASNQFYIADETYDDIRFSIQPNNGSIYMQGNSTQDFASYGTPKYMVYLNGDGTISRCYNSVSGTNTSGCGIAAGRAGGSGYYSVNFPFDITNRFLSLSVVNDLLNPVVCNHYVTNGILFINTQLADGTHTDRPVMIIVY